MKTSAAAARRPALALRERLELLRARGAAERLAIGLAQLELRERVHVLRRTAGWGVGLLRLLLRARGGVAELAGGHVWWRVGTWVLPLLLVALRRGRRRPGTGGADRAEQPGQAAGGAVLATALVRLVRRLLRRRAPSQQAPGAGS